MRRRLHAHDRLVVGRGERVGERHRRAAAAWRPPTVTSGPRPDARALVRLDRHRGGGRVRALPPVRVEVVELLQVLLLDVRQGERPPADVLAGRVAGAGLVSTRTRGTRWLASWKLCRARPSCLRLFWHCIRAAASRTFCTAGRSSPIRMAMMAMTTSNSISVNARRARGDAWGVECQDSEASTISFPARVARAGISGAAAYPTNRTDPSANTQSAPPGCWLQKWWAVHGSVSEPGPYPAARAAGPEQLRWFGHPRAESYADHAHQPQSRSGAGDGGRSPSSRVPARPVEMSTESGVRPAVQDAVLRPAELQIHVGGPTAPACTGSPRPRGTRSGRTGRRGLKFPPPRWPRGGGRTGT